MSELDSDSSKRDIEAELPLADDLAGLKTIEWSRVSPLAIVYFFVKTVYTLATSVLVYSLPALAVSYSKLKDNPVYFVIGVSAVLGLILLGSLIKYWFYFYKFTNDRVEIKQGVLKKSLLDLPFEKIQSVKIVQPFYYRFNNFSFIELDTAGSASQEAKIVALPLTLAESFKQKILQINDNSHAESDDFENTKHEVTSNKEILLNKRSLWDLVIHGISNNRVWIFLGFLAPFYNTITDNIGRVLDSIGFDIFSYLDYQSQSIGLFMLHVLSLVMLIMLVIVSFSVIGSIFVFYNYTLTRLGERYIRRSGLFTKQEVSMRLSRIQIAVQQQDWLDVLLRRVNLRFEQNTSKSVESGQAGNINNASKLIVPSVTPSESATLIKDSFAISAFSELNFSRISKRFIVRVFFVRLLPIFALVYTLVGTNENATVVTWFSLGAITIIVFLLVVLRWRRWGYYLTDDFIYIRKGLLGVNYYVFPVGKLQQARVSQSIFMRRSRLADLQYVLASGAYKIPLMPQQLAKQQADFALNIVARDKPSWM